MTRSFLNDLDRIATRDYVVTDDDIVRARLRTVGIQEHRLFLTKPGWDTTKGKAFLLESSHEYPLTRLAGGKGGWEWRIFDVGGCRTSVRDQRLVLPSLTSYHSAPHGRHTLKT